jgi:glycosyltransferase involved in cell wall biosynthesis
MLPGTLTGPRRVLMTVDSVGGIWRYAIDLARGLNERGIACLLVGSGPHSPAADDFASLGLPDTELTWTDEPLDWMVQDEAGLDSLPATLAGLARAWRADLLHLNLPSQAAGLPAELPVLVASHSCVPTWWETMRGGPLPAEWAWQQERNRRGLQRADSVIVPSASHAAALNRSYGTIERLSVVHNATTASPSDADKEPFVLAAGRWWDEGKNASTLDRAARSSPWPVVMAGPLAGPNGQAVSIEHATPAGELPSGYLLDLMRRAGIFAAPSRYEPFGLAVLEAAVNHAALVLADIPTFRELWNGAALFVAPTDAAGFADAIAMLAGNDSLRCRFGAEAARVAETFNPARQIDGVIAAYAKAMTRHHHPDVPREYGAG